MGVFFFYKKKLALRTPTVCRGAEQEQQGWAKKNRRFFLQLNALTASPLII